MSAGAGVGAATCFFALLHGRVVTSVVHNTAHTLDRPGTHIIRLCVRGRALDVSCDAPSLLLLDASGASSGNLGNGNALARRIRAEHDRFDSLGWQKQNFLLAISRHDGVGNLLLRLRHSCGNPPCFFQPS